MSVDGRPANWNAEHALIVLLVLINVLALNTWQSWVFFLACEVAVPCYIAAEGLAP